MFQKYQLATRFQDALDFSKRSGLIVNRTQHRRRYHGVDGSVCHIHALCTAPADVNLDA
jgi:hypothetical protein